MPIRFESQSSKHSYALLYCATQFAFEYLILSIRTIQAQIRRAEVSHGFVRCRTHLHIVVAAEEVGSSLFAELWVSKLSHWSGSAKREVLARSTARFDSFVRVEDVVDATEENSRD